MGSGQWALRALLRERCSWQAGKQKQSARRRARASHSPPGPVGRDDASLRWASQKLNCAERAERISLSSGRFSGRAPLAGSQKLLFCWPRSGTVAVCRGSGVGGVQQPASSKQQAAGQRVLGLRDVLVRTWWPRQRCSPMQSLCLQALYVPTEVPVAGRRH